MRWLLLLVCVASTNSWAAEPQVCTPTTCNSLGANCGAVDDGCGNVLTCGTCTSSHVCGATAANVCGAPPTCTGLCLQQQVCANPTLDTTISGTVYMPNGTLPIAGAVVYVPNGAVGAPTYGVQPFTPGVACETCATPPTGSPLTVAISDYSGSFVIRNAPAGASIPLVIQVGRWRRQIVIPTVAACANTALSSAQTHLPQTAAEGDIPAVGVVTGAADGLECMLRQVGVADTEFSDPSGGGRVKMYTGRAAAGAQYDANTPTDASLYATDIDQYDVLLLASQGAVYSPTPGEFTKFNNYANAGGRVMLDQFEYSWLATNAPFSGAAAWHVGQPYLGSDPDTALLDTSVPRLLTLATLLQQVNASTTFGQIQVSGIHRDYDNAIAPSVNWLATQSASVPVQFDSATPIAARATQQCGRVEFLDHLPYAASTSGTTFPAECAGPMTPSQVLAAYTLFDATHCQQADLSIAGFVLLDGNRQVPQPNGEYAIPLRAQVFGVPATFPLGSTVTFTIVPGTNGAGGSFISSQGASSNFVGLADYDGIVTTPRLATNAWPPSGQFTVTVTSSAGAPQHFKLYAGDVIFADDFEE